MTWGRNIPKWHPRWVGISHTSGPSPSREALRSEPPYVPPEEREFPIGFNLPVPPPKPERKTRLRRQERLPEPQLWEGDGA